MKNGKRMVAVLAMLLIVVQCCPLVGFAAAETKVDLKFDTMEEKDWEMQENGWFLRTNSWNNPNNDVTHGVVQAPVKKTGDKAMIVRTTKSVGTIDIYNDNGKACGTIVSQNETRPYQFSVDMMVTANNSNALIEAGGIRWVRFDQSGAIQVGGPDLITVGSFVKGAWYHITVIFYGNQENGDVYINDVKVAENVKLRWNTSDLAPFYVKTFSNGSNAFDTYIDNLKITRLDSVSDYVPNPSKLTSSHLYDGRLYYSFPAGANRASVKKMIGDIDNPDGHVLSVVGPCNDYLGDAAPYYTERAETHTDLRQSFLLEKDADGNLLQMYPICDLSSNAASQPLTFNKPEDLYSARVMCDFSWKADSHDYARLVPGLYGKQSTDQVAQFAFLSDISEDVKTALGSAARYYDTETIDGVDNYFKGVKAYWEPNGGFAGIGTDTAKKVHFSFQIMMDSYDHAVYPRLGNTNVYPIRFDRNGVIGVGRKGNEGYREVGKWDTNRWYTVDLLLDSSSGNAVGTVYLDGESIADNVDFGTYAQSYTCLYMMMLQGRMTDPFKPGNVYLDNISCAVDDDFAPKASSLSYTDKIGDTLFAGSRKSVSELLADVTVADGRTAKVYDKAGKLLSGSDALSDGCRLIETDDTDTALLYTYPIKTSGLTNIMLDKEKQTVTVAADDAAGVPDGGKLILAGYDAEGNLQSAVFGTVFDAAARYVAGKKMYEKNVVLEEGAAYPQGAATVKAFLWQDMIHMNPLCAPAK